MAEGAPEVPILVFDGHCGFCTGAADWVRRHATAPVRAVPGQAADLEALGLTDADVRAAAWWIDERGRRQRGHRAMARAFAHCDGAARWLGLALERPLLAPLSAAGYALVSRFRSHLPGAPPACRDPERWPGPCRDLGSGTQGEVAGRS